MDYNDDGMLDIIVGERYGFVHYYRRTSESPITLTEEADIVCSGVTIDVGENSAPVIVDWNEDGDIDMLLGNQTGNVRLYLNDNPDTQPIFTSYSNIQSSGSDILHYRNCPQVYDMDMDGRKDLLCGADNYNIYWYRNEGTNAAPVFAGSEVIVNTGYYGARFWIDDWNEDGLPDVIASNYNGYVQIYIQQTTGIEGGGSELDRQLLVEGNPFYASVSLSAEGFTSGTISIYDITGRTVLSESFSGSFLWNGSEVAPGAYFVEIRDGQGTATARLLKL